MHASAMLVCVFQLAILGSFGLRSIQAYSVNGMSVEGRPTSAEIEYVLCLPGFTLHLQMAPPIRPPTVVVKKLGIMWTQGSLRTKIHY